MAWLLFGRAHLGADDLIVLGNTLAGYLLGLPVLLAGLIYARAFLVLRRTDWLLKVSVAQLAAKFVLNAALMPFLGLPASQRRPLPSMPLDRSLTSGVFTPGD